MESPLSCDSRWPKTEAVMLTVILWGGWVGVSISRVHVVRPHLYLYDITESLWRSIFGFLCRQFRLEFGRKFRHPLGSTWNRKYKKILICTGISSYQEFRWTLLGLGGSQFLLHQKIQINFFWVFKNKVVTLITVLNTGILKKCLTKSKSAEKEIKAENYIMETSFLKKSPSFTNKLSRAKRNFSVTYGDIKSPDDIMWLDGTFFS